MITGMGFIGTKPGKLYRMNGRRTVEKTASGNPITLTDSAENKPLNMKLYGWSKQDGEPSPDNPVEIESAGMRWSMGKNLVNADDYYSAYKQADGTYKSKTVTLNDIRISLSEFVGKEITISVKLTVGANVSGVFLMYISSEQKKINGSVIRSGLTGKSILTVTPASNTDYFVISFGSGNDDVIFSELQLELGSVATSYEPYTGGKPSPSPEYPQDIVSVGGSGSINVEITGKNLLNPYLKKSTTVNGITCVPNGDGTYTLNGTATKKADFIVFTVLKMSSSSLFGKTLKIVGCPSGGNRESKYAFYLQRQVAPNYIPIIADEGNGSSSLEFNDSIDGAWSAWIRINSGYTCNNLVFKPMITTDLSATYDDFEPYKQPQAITIVTPTGLPAIPVPSDTSGITYTDANGQAWIADEIDFSKGKYIQNVGKVDLENLSWHLIGNDFRSGAISDSKVYAWTTEIANLICSHYACKMTSYNMNYNSDGQDNLIGMYTNQIEIKDTRYNKDVDLFKQSLSGVYAYYVLAIPVERDLTSAELAEYIQLYSYKPTTVVENDSDCWMDVTYRGKK